MIHLFGITGHIGHGKSLFAKCLAHELDHMGFVSVITHFATPVKRIARECFGWDGVKDERGRKLLQVIGTDAGRHYDPDIWVRAWLRECGGGCPQGPTIIVDDVRFDNEAKIIRDMGGKLIFVARDAKGIEAGHESENGIKFEIGDSHLRFPYHGEDEMRKTCVTLVAMMMSDTLAEER